MNPDLTRLQPYPFEKLRALLTGATPPQQLAGISLAVGEPQHPAPARVVEALLGDIASLSAYPTTRGLAQLRSTICVWLTMRFKLAATPIDPERHVLPVNGTREALFAFAQVVVERSAQATVVMPNPFYQIYEGAAIMAGAQPVFLDCTADNQFHPDFDSVSADTWRRCQLLYLCSPGNPTGAVLDLPTLKKVIALADEYDFVIASDECYSEIYHDENRPPPGLLQACAALDRADFRRCVVFHSLSKRSNLPGLRSGFVAGDADILEKFLLYRTYHGCAMPVQHQIASVAAWSDEQHVRENRQQYREKFLVMIATLAQVLPVQLPDAGFYLWAQTPAADDRFARDLYAQQHVTLVPGRYLARTGKNGNPGENRVRMALVASVEECREAARRIVSFLEP